MATIKMELFFNCYLKNNIYMGYFPGNIMIVDDQYGIVHHVEPEGREEKIQYNSFVNLKIFCEANGIPLISVTDVDNAEQLIDKIKKYDNIRLLILDLDLNNDGSVNPEDDYLTVYLILETAIKKFGYFFLLISSAHSDAWENIKANLPDTINASLITNLSDVFDKTTQNSIYDKIENVSRNFSLELIYHFESELNSARDKAFSSFLDFENKTWQKIYSALISETGLQSHSDITSILLSLIKQQMLGVKYPDVERVQFEGNKSIIRLIFRTLNYTLNKNNVLSSQLVWTGNLYETDKSNDRKYALIITPECDIAQNKHLYYKAVFGFSINEETFPNNYDNENYTLEQLPPLFPHRVGLEVGNKWRTKRDLTKIIEKKRNPNQYLYALPFIPNDESDLFVDFRDVQSISGNEIKIQRWNLLLRINEPMITNILDSYSNLLNRKGLLPIL